MTNDYEKTEWAEAYSEDIDPKSFETQMGVPDDCMTGAGDVDDTTTTFAMPFDHTSRRSNYIPADILRRDMFPTGGFQIYMGHPSSRFFYNNLIANVGLYDGDELHLVDSLKRAEIRKATKNDPVYLRTRNRTTGANLPITTVPRGYPVDFATELFNINQHPGESDGEWFRARTNNLKFSHPRALAALGYVPQLELPTPCFGEAELEDANMSEDFGTGAVSFQVTIRVISTGDAGVHRWMSKEGLY